MIEALSEMAARNEDVLRALTRLKNGEIEDAIADFAEEFCFNDRGLGLEFTNRQRLREFLQKERELYPDSSFQAKNIPHCVGTHVPTVRIRHLHVSHC